MVEKSPCYGDVDGMPRQKVVEIEMTPITKSLPVALSKAKGAYFCKIPSYGDMDQITKSHFEALYLLACCPGALLKPSTQEHAIAGDRLPDNLSDLNALVYFILIHNLSVIVINNEVTEITPYLPCSWAEKTGLRVLYTALLDILSPISEAKSIYFTVLLSSLMLRLHSADQEGYCLIYKLMLSIFEAQYNKVFKDIVRQLDLSVPMVRFLPISIPAVQQDLKDSLTGIARSLIYGQNGRPPMFASPQSGRELNSGSCARRNSR